MFSSEDELSLHLLNSMLSLTREVLFYYYVIKLILIQSLLGLDCWSWQPETLTLVRNIVVIHVSMSSACVYSYSFYCYYPILVCC